MTLNNHIAFVCPRFAEGSTVGGAETLLKDMAIRTAAMGRKVTFLTTCARDHFTWKNEIPPGTSTINNIEIKFFPVNENRNINAFLRTQEAISRGATVSEEEENVWLTNNVNSHELIDHLRKHQAEYDKIVMGPYLFGLIYFAAVICPSKTMLVPCLHDEPFARLKAFREMFHNVYGIMFNTIPEHKLAQELFNMESCKTFVVGMGLDDLTISTAQSGNKYQSAAPYVIYSGRREPLKGTPLLIDYMKAFRSRTHRDIKLMLTGKGAVDIPAELSAHVLDIGFVPEEEKRHAMAGAIAFCHPSVNESLGIVILEAWLAGTPAIVHGKGRVLPYQCEKSGGGLWFNTYPEFEEELIMLMDNQELRNNLASAGRKYVLEHYSREVIDQKTAQALNA